MDLTPIKLVTIIGPKKIKKEIMYILRSAGISGYTYYYVYGGGEHQLRGDELEEAENVKFRVLVPKLLAVTLMKVISESYFGKEKVVAFEHDANVIRTDKFKQVDYEAT